MECYMMFNTIFVAIGAYFEPDIIKAVTRYFCGWLV